MGSPAGSRIGSDVGERDNRWEHGLAKDRCRYGVQIRDGGGAVLNFKGKLLGFPAWGGTKSSNNNWWKRRRYGESMKVKTPAAVGNRARARLDFSSWNQKSSRGGAADEYSYVAGWGRHGQRRGDAKWKLGGAAAAGWALQRWQQQRWVKIDLAIDDDGLFDLQDVNNGWLISAVIFVTCRYDGLMNLVTVMVRWV